MSASESKQALDVQAVEGFRSSLQDQGDSLVSASQRLIRLLALIKVFALSFICLLGCLLVDYLTQIEESGFRFLLFGIWFGVTFACGWLLLRPAWRFAPTKAELASWIELQQPELGDRLSTAVMLAESDFSDPRYGSVQLRVSLLSAMQNDPLIGNLNWSVFLDKARLLRTLVYVLICGLVALAVYVWQPDISQLSLKRFFAPWSANPWPKQDQLAFVDLPAAMGIAESLQVEVIDRQPPLPSDVRLQVREVNDPSSVIEIGTAPVNDSAVANLPPFSNAIEIRAFGGDDNAMAWQYIDVIEAPTIKSAQFEVQPPEYFGSETQVIKGRRIRVLEDSRVVLTGEFTSPVQELKVDNAAAATAVEIELDPAGAKFRATFVAALKESISWRFEVESEGLRLKLQDLWNVEVVADEPPEVSLETDSLSSVTIQGVLAIAGLATDDQGLQDVAVHMKSESGAGVDLVESKQAETQEKVFPLWSNLQSNQVVKRRKFSDRVVLQNTMDTLEQGDQLLVWVQAIDSKGQVGVSDAIKLTIAEPTEVLAEIEREQNALSDELRALVKRQSRNRDQVAVAAQRLEQREAITRGTVDNFRSLARNQEGISRSLEQAGDSASIKSQLNRVRELLQANNLGETQLAQNLEDLNEKLGRLAAEEVGQASDSIGDATEALGKGIDQPSANYLRLVEKALDGQQRAADSLEQLIDDIDRQESMRDVERGIERVAKEQRSVGRELEQLQLEALEGANLEEISDRMKQLGSDQIGLAQGLESLLKRAGELTGSEGDERPADVTQGQLEEDLQEIGNRLANQRIPELMREGARQLNASQMADASQTQKEIEEALSEVLGQPRASAAQSSLDNVSAAELQAASKSLGEIAEAQRKLSDEMRKAESAAQQKALAERQAELGRKTEQLPRLGSELDLEQAGELQQQAGELIQEGQNEKAATASDEAAGKLDQIQRELSQRANDAREMSLANLQQQTKEISNKQNGLVESISVLEETESQLSSEQWRQQTTLQADVQDGIMKMLFAIRDELEKLPAFEIAVAQAQSQMERAAASLRRQRLPEASLAATDALRILNQMVQALEEAKSEAKNEATDGDQQQQGEEDGGDQTGKLPPLASLKLLRNMQRDLRQQTEQANIIQEPAARKQRLDNLAELQRQLGERVRSLLIEFQGQKQEQLQ